MSHTVARGLMLVLLGVVVAPTWARADEADPADCPIWVKEQTPAWVAPFLGPRGLPEPYASMKEPLAMVVKGIDRWQANHFVVYRPETRQFLYKDYTSLKVDYRPGTLPEVEALVERYTRGLRSDREKVLACLTRAIPAEFPHPSIPPLGEKCPTDRNLEDERMLRTGVGWCNEQARVFVRMCQIMGVPARMVFLFYSDRKSGHVISEVYLEGRWCMMDSSFCCVFPGEDGRLLSAAECHDPSNARWVAKAYRQRLQEAVAGDDEQVAGRQVSGRYIGETRKRKVHEIAEASRREWGSKTEQWLAEWLWEFGVMNYPLPQPVPAR